MKNNFTHIPVLLKEAIGSFQYLKKTGGVFVDGTIGLAGHSIYIAQLLLESKKSYKLIGIDKDEMALLIAQKKLLKFSQNCTFAQNDFKNIAKILDDLKIEKIDGAILDLGVSSMQLDDESRGFSFEDRDAKLDMRMDTRQKLSASTVVNNYSESELVKLFYQYGEEKHSRTIVYNICKKRKAKPILFVGELCDIIENSIPLYAQKKSKKNPATNVFRALRIEVNSEYKELDKAIISFINYLNPHARLNIITFNSVEDRIVKNVFRDLSKNCSCPENSPICMCDQKPLIKLINKKPIIPNNEEIEDNSRSRSSKLRIIEKI